ncbi:MAG: M10 family metallopeptidase C-terminal domain-containing protein [Rhizobiales bacterium]|nr:M10 family metallopeptidase C-terminal domain-containing protein [Hyphomicrobiales bacterium]
MLPDDPIDYTFFFQGYSQVDNSNVLPLTLFLGSTTANYSSQTELGFTLSRDGYKLDVEGSDFVYDGGVPTGGTVIGITVRIGNAAIFSISGELPLSTFFTSDAETLATTLFAKNDVINGYNLGDTLYGFDGADIMGGLAGTDLMYGGNGNDQVSGGDDDDKLYGDTGDDWLTGGKGDDKLFGGDGFDIASFSDKLAPVVVDLGKGKTVKAKIGFSEVDKLNGIEGVWGGLGKDKLTGNGGDNALGGNSGDDVLKGKGGDDLLVGYWGSDTLVGGKGADTFLFDRIAASNSWTDVDFIKDFQVGKDTIALGEVFPELTPGVLSPDEFYAAPGAISGQNGQHVVYDTKNGVLYYDPSGDGSGYVYKLAVLKGAPTISASDFFVESVII